MTWPRWSRRSPDAPARVGPGAPVARLEAVDLVLGRRVVVRALDLVVPAGEVVAIVGPNGAGKSTALAALAGDLRPRSGRVWLGACDIATLRPLELARRRSVLPQRSGVAFPFTVTEVVRMGRACWAGGDPAADDAAVDGALREVDVAHLAARAFSTLSGGEQARVALARVLAQDTQLLLLDEPTAALDLRHEELVLRVARRRARAGAGVVVVLHDLSLAAAHADRVVLLRRGELVAQGPPAAVLTAARLSEVYEHPVEVHHPTSGALIVQPVRATDDGEPARLPANKLPVSVSSYVGRHRDHRGHDGRAAPAR